QRQLEYIKRVIDRSDYYVLIIGDRYGSLTEEGISYTEAEYDYAVGKLVPVLAFLHRKPEDLPRSSTDKSPRLAKKLQAFREKVSGPGTRVVDEWENKHELAAAVGASLGAAIAEFPRPGWVRGDQVANQTVLAELNEVRKRNEEVESRLADAL